MSGETIGIMIVLVIFNASLLAIIILKDYYHHKEKDKIYDWVDETIDKYYRINK